MNRWLRWSILAGLLLWMTFAVPAAQAKTVQGDKVVIGDSYVLPAGQTLEGDLVVIGGEATVEQGARVTGNVRVLGGALVLDGTVEGNFAVTGGQATVDGTIHGNVKVLGGNVSFGEHAVVDGKVYVVSGDVRGKPGAKIRIVLAGPNWGWRHTFGPKDASVSFLVRSVWRGILAFLRAIALAVLAGVVFLFPGGLARDAIAKMESAPLVAGGIGLLIFALLPVVVVALVITIVLIPLAVVVGVVVAVAALYGWLVLGLYLGEKMLAQLHQSWHPAGVAALGTFVLTLLAALVNIVPCVGWIPGFLAAVLGLGAVCLALWGAWQQQSGKGLSGGDEIVAASPPAQEG